MNKSQIFIFLIVFFFWPLKTTDPTVLCVETLKHLSFSDDKQNLSNVIH